MINMEWYETLIKPAFTPSVSVFKIVWPLLYLCMAFSFVLVWQSKNSGRQKAMFCFFIQLVLNFAWSPIFFGMKDIDGALLVIIILLINLSFVIWRFFKISKAAGYLLLPYWLWVCFAVYLNFAIWKLN